MGQHKKNKNRFQALMCTNRAPAHSVKLGSCFGRCGHMSYTTRGVFAPVRAGNGRGHHQRSCKCANMAHTDTHTNPNRALLGPSECARADSQSMMFALKSVVVVVVVVLHVLGATSVASNGAHVAPLGTHTVELR